MKSPNYSILALLIFCLAIPFSESQAQIRIDSTLAFQDDPAKSFSIYIPSTYSEDAPNSLMLGLHPFNTSRWDGRSWCDTLLAFAEMNDLILLCPDGGLDGQIDDPIDTAFISHLLELMPEWYNVNEDKVFAMGFSWGGLTTYTYGLNHIDKFAGLMPIGAAISGISQFEEVIGLSEDKAFYVLHGSLDSPNSRYYPAIEALEENGACLETVLMSGVGHTIDFPNRNEILTEAFIWLDNVVCAIPDTLDVAEICQSSIETCVPSIFESTTPTVFCLDFCELPMGAELTEVTSVFNCSVEIYEELCFSFLPLPGLENDILEAIVCDETGACASINFEVTMGCQDPEPKNDSIYLNGESSYLLDLLINDFDVCGHSLFIDSLQLESEIDATVEIVEDGLKVQFNPMDGFTGAFSLNYIVCNDCGSCAFSSALVEVLDTVQIDTMVLDTMQIDTMQMDTVLSGVSNIEFESIRLAPNPSSGAAVYLKNLYSEEKIIRINVFQVNGKSIDYRLVGNRIDLLNASTGIYLISVETNRRKELLKLLID